MALLYAMVLGADGIEDTDVLRAGRTGRLLGGWIPAFSTLGTFLRAFTFGHVRQLDALLGGALERAWKAGAGPGEGRLVIDVDSFVGEVWRRLKQGAAYGYTQVVGYHRSSRPGPTRGRRCTFVCGPAASFQPPPLGQQRHPAAQIQPSRA